MVGVIRQRNWVIVKGLNTISEIKTISSFNAF